MPVVVGVDLGGTSVRAEVVDATGAVLAAARRPTALAEGADAGRRGGAAFEAVVEVVAEASGRSPVPPAAAGVAIPGLVDVARGRSVWSVNLGWRDLPVTDLLAARLDLPVALEHDVTAAGIAEHALGAGRGCDDLLVVVCGTGVSAVVFCDGRLVRGGRGQAGELGHVVVRPGGRPCRCGARGCLEAEASARAVGLAYAARRGGPAGGPAGGPERGPAGGSAEVVALLGRDPDADAVWADAVDALADGILTGVAVLGSDRVVVGGGLSEAGDALLVPLRAAVERRATVQTLPDVVRAGLGARAGVVGAALAARDLLARTAPGGAAPGGAAPGGAWAGSPAPGGAEGA